MKEFNWYADILPCWKIERDGEQDRVTAAYGADSVTAEELYQAIKARLIEECGIPRHAEVGLLDRMQQMRED